MSAGSASRVETLYRRAKRTSGPGSACSTSPAAPPILRSSSRAASARAVRSCSPTSIRRCWHAAATACSTRAYSAPAVQCDAEQLPFRGCAFRLRERRFRAAQHDAQGPRAGRNAPRAEARRTSAGARILARLAAAAAALRRVFAQGLAAARQTGRQRQRRATAISPSRSAFIRTRNN